MEHDQEKRNQQELLEDDEDEEEDGEGVEEHERECDLPQITEDTLTERGFALVEFKDAYGQVCTLQESSVYTHVWLGVMVNLNGEKVNQRMHLSQQQVAALLPRLQAFVESGQI